jgi:hypothetical protein
MRFSRDECIWLKENRAVGKKRDSRSRVGLLVKASA